MACWSIHRCSQLFCDLLQQRNHILVITFYWYTSKKYNWMEILVMMINNLIILWTARQIFWAEFNDTFFTSLFATWFDTSCSTTRALICARYWGEQTNNKQVVLFSGNHYHTHTHTPTHIHTDTPYTHIKMSFFTYYFSFLYQCRGGGGCGCGCVRACVCVCVW